MNIGAALRMPYTAKQRVLGMQTKLHSWAAADRGRRFDDLFNLVYDPCFLAHGVGPGPQQQGSPHGRDRRTHRAFHRGRTGWEWKGFWRTCEPR